MSIFPDDSAERKTFPLYSGVLQYFPSALAKLARHSYVSNEKHNPGEPIHWARGKSDDHLDAAARHLIEGDLAGLAWRALAALQLQCEADGAPVAPGARNAEPRYTLKLDAGGRIKMDPSASYIDWRNLSRLCSGHVACQSGEVVK